jgi:hypothetical protein
VAANIRPAATAMIMLLVIPSLAFTVLVTPFLGLGLYVSQETANGEFVARWSVGQDETGREIMEAAQSAA